MSQREIRLEKLRSCGFRKKWPDLADERLELFGCKESFEAIEVLPFWWELVRRVDLHRARKFDLPNKDMRVRSALTLDPLSRNIYPTCPLRIAGVRWKTLDAAGQIFCIASLLSESCLKDGMTISVNGIPRMDSLRNAEYRHNFDKRLAALVTLKSLPG